MPEDLVQLQVDTIVMVCPASSWQGRLDHVLAVHVALRLPVPSPPPSRFLQDRLPLQTLKASLWHPEVCLAYNRKLACMQGPVLLRACCDPCVVVLAALHPRFPPKVLLLLVLHVFIDDVPHVVIHRGRHSALRHLQVLLLPFCRRPQSPRRIRHRIPSLLTLTC